ncbi:hypothetical protein [Cytobacillus firmus]|uniref:hypothetical protein n=1 Tax=Cytobacillus firmus TaxID=1399 RepID=UPI0018CD5C7A|nr:hypothetical protein [Cytobacillus firmus]
MVGFTARSMPGTGEVNQSYQHPHLIKRWGLFYAYEIKGTVSKDKIINPLAKAMDEKNENP